MDVKKPTREYPSHGEAGTDFVPDFGIIIPHTLHKQGAQSPKGMTEYNYGLIMSEVLVLPTALRNVGGVKDATKQLLKEGCNASLEPHKNAYNGKAHGFEILCIKGDKLSEKYARLFAEAFHDKFGRRLRADQGVKFVSKGDRGYNNLRDAKRAGMDVALLSEAFFIDNPSEWLSPTVMGNFWKEQLV